MQPDWLAFWNGKHSIYVSRRHRDVHYRLIAQAIVALVPDRHARVLDYGCGEALHADAVTEAADEVLLCEAAPGLRAALEYRFAANAKIRVVAAHDVARLPDHSLDLVILHSVLQYLTPTGAGALLTLFHRLLKPGGRLVIGDVIAPNTSAATDALALLRFGRANRFFFAALWGLVRTVFSDYWRLRSRLGLTRYGEDAILEKLRAAGFAAERAAANFGHNRARRTYYARPQ
jgi:SAM-dependent methyltransferase